MQASKQASTLRSHTQPHPAKLVQMFADGSREINRIGHGGQTLHEAVYDLSFVRLPLIGM